MLIIRLPFADLVGRGRVDSEAAIAHSFREFLRHEGPTRFVRRLGWRYDILLLHPLLQERGTETPGSCQPGKHVAHIIYAQTFGVGAIDEGPE